MQIYIYKYDYLRSSAYNLRNTVIKIKFYEYLLFRVIEYKMQ